MTPERPDLITEIRQNLERPVEAATTLLAVHLYAASAEMVWIAVEMAAGYFVGSQGRAPSKASVLSFAKAYLPELGSTSPGDLALVEHPDDPAESCAEVLYACFHGGLLHDGERATGVHCLDDKGKWMVSFEPGGLVKLNVLPFHCQFERGLKQFLRDLKADDDLAAFAEARSAFLAKPTVVPHCGTTMRDA